VNVQWTLAAWRERDDIYDYIAANSPSAAKRMDLIFRNAASRLADFPYMGKQGQLPGTRELFPHRNYRMIYEVDANTGIIWILALIHGARNWLPKQGGQAAADSA